ncbi:MAG: hypothetical protein ACLTPR_09035 [Enterococcus canintestini]|uniref:hypothetical protein n=1 Tax=Enterococcus canintestini TaxID=317010 RepID=UPI0039967107
MKKVKTYRLSSHQNKKASNKKASSVLNLFHFLAMLLIAKKSHYKRCCQLVLSPHLKCYKMPLQIVALNGSF